MFQLNYLILICLCCLIDSRHISKRVDKCTELINCIFDPESFKNANNQTALVFDIAASKPLFDQYCVRANAARDCTDGKIEACTNASLRESSKQSVLAYEYICSAEGKREIDTLAVNTCKNDRKKQEKVVDDNDKCFRDKITKRFPQGGASGSGSTNTITHCSAIREMHSCVSSVSNTCGEVFVAYVKRTNDKIVAQNGNCLQV